MWVWLSCYTIALTINLPCHPVSGSASSAAPRAKLPPLARDAKFHFWQRPELVPKWTPTLKAGLSDSPNNNNNNSYTSLALRMQRMFDVIMVGLGKKWSPRGQKNQKSPQTVKAKDSKRLLTHPFLSSPYQPTDRGWPALLLPKEESFGRPHQERMVVIRELAKLHNRLISNLLQYSDRPRPAAYFKRKAAGDLREAKRNRHNGRTSECPGLYNTLCHHGIVPGCIMIRHEGNCSIVTECVRQSACLPQQLHLAAAHCFGAAKIFQYSDDLDENSAYDYGISIVDNQNDTSTILRRQNELLYPAQRLVNNQLARLLTGNLSFVKFSTWARKIQCSN